jgi:acyl-coenzyme A synthetase/AMP-(fatty) acid ligase
VSPNPVAGRVRRAGAADPAAPAIEDGERSWSYAELAVELTAAGAALRSAGVRPGQLAVLHAQRLARLPVALLAAWELGATVAIVDGTLPAARRSECERVVRPAWRLGLDEAGALSVGQLAEDGAAARDPASHVLFTSGTTGRPAAVEVGCGALDRTLAWYVRTFGFGAPDRVGLLGGLGHDPLLRDSLVPLTSGGTLVVPPPDVFADPQKLWSFVHRARLTVLHCTPALLELILAADPAPGGAGAGLAGLRLVVSAGAPLTCGLARRLRAATGATLVNAFGATETPQIVSCHVVSAADTAPGNGRPDEAPVGVGTGVNGAELMLAGPADPGGTGSQGQIVVRSPHLARGYLPGTGTPGRFTADPLGVPGYRAYRTGDLGRRDGDHGIVIEGRLDRQISVNGHRLAPEEIEAAVLRHPDVVRAVAGPLTGPAGDLVELGVELAPAAGADARALRAFLRSVLPGYAVPSRIRIVSALPLTANHKLSMPGPPVS